MTGDQAIVELDAPGLRRFGLTTGLILAGIFGVFLPWLLEHELPMWPWVVAGVLIAWGLLAPISLRPVYVVWMKFGLLLGKVTSPIVLSIIFAIAILPPALIMKLVRRDPMQRQFDNAAGTYRIPSRPLSKDNLKRPF